MFFSMAYASLCAEEVSLAQVENIWLNSIVRNEDADITGALFFGGRYFIQVLEGDEDDVLALYRRISGDARHHDIQKISEADIATRMFRRWPMKLMNGSGSAHLREMFDYGRLVDASIQDREKAVFRLAKL